MNWSGRGGRKYGGQWHPSSCACPRCDPDDTKLAAQRARFLAEEKARAAAVAAGAPPPPAPARPSQVRRIPRADDASTKRYRELLATGISHVRAMEVVEAEFSRRETT